MLEGRNSSLNNGASNGDLKGIMAVCLLFRPLPLKQSTPFRNTLLSVFCLLGMGILAFPYFGSVIRGNVALADNSNNIYYQHPQSAIPRQAGIAVNTFPVGVAVNPSTNMIYVTNEFSNTLSVINGINDKLEHSIPVGKAPYDVDVDQYTNKIYVANQDSNTISVIDGSTNAVIGDIKNVQTPVGLDVDPVKSWIYVTNIQNNTLSKIDAMTNKVVKNVTVGKSPYSVDINEGRKYKIYVTNTGSNTVSVIDGDSFELLANITVGKYPVGLAVNAKTNTVYVANRASNTVSVINGTSDTVVKNVTVGQNPDNLDINFKTGKIYVTNTGSNTVSVIDGLRNTEIGRIMVNTNLSPELEAQALSLPPSVQFPNVASFIDVNQDKNMIYVTNTGSNIVSVINGTTNNLVVGLAFNIDPPNSGRIKCVDGNGKNDIDIYNTNKYARFDYGIGLECSPYSYSGYTFNFWSGDLAKNAKPPVTIRNLGDSIVDWFTGLVSSKSPPMKITSSEYNQALTANFKAGPDYMALLILPIIFLSIPLAIHGIRLFYKKIRKTVNEGNYLRRHKKTICDAYNASQRNKSEALDRLVHIRNDIIHDYYKGNIKDRNYEELVNNISDFLQRIRTT